MTDAYPLAWPDGWPRTVSHNRKRGQFGVAERRYNPASQTSRDIKRALSIEDAVKRVRYEIERLGIDVAEDMIISTNLKRNLRGLPRGDQGEPLDPGAAVYWQKAGKPMRVMAIDAYSRVADNLGAIAATLEAMRAIERHGGAQILDRAFSGFTALPAPKSPWAILGVPPGSSKAEVESAYRRKASSAHPDREGGSTAAMAELNAARDALLKGERVE